MAGAEYGLTDTSSVGMVVSGAYQSVRPDGGKSTGDIFYTGVYGKKAISNFDITAGLGYQLGKYKSDNKVVERTVDKSYNVNAYSVYTEGKYTIDLGDNVAVVPKVKLAYSYVDQDNISDEYFNLKKGKISVFDTEVGVDFIKTAYINAGKINTRFGVSYLNAAGDTDKKFKGSFRGNDNDFDVLGAKISKNTAKFELGMDLVKESGISYSLGTVLNTSSKNTRDFGVTAGVGYKF